MKNINKWLAVLLAALCLLSLVACKGDEPEIGGDGELYGFVIDGVKVIPGAKASDALTALASQNPATSSKGSCLGGVDGEDVNYVYAGFRIQTFRLKEGDANEEIRWITLTDDSVKTEEGIAIGSTVEALKAAYGEPVETTSSTIIYRSGKTELRFETRDGAVIGIAYTVAES
jgi:hypothetical protein